MSSSSVFRLAVSAALCASVAYSDTLPPVLALLSTQTKNILRNACLFSVWLRQLRCALACAYSDTLPCQKRVLLHRQKISCANAFSVEKWWGRTDLNRSRRSQRVYSPSPLTTRAHPHFGELMHFSSCTLTHAQLLFARKLLNSTGYQAACQRRPRHREWLSHIVAWV